MKRLLGLSTIVAVGVVAVGNQAMANVDTAVVGPVRTIQDTYWNPGDQQFNQFVSPYEDAVLNQRISDTLAMLPGFRPRVAPPPAVVQVAAPAPLKCVPAGTIVAVPEPLPLPVPTVEPGPFKLDTPYQDAALNARIFDTLMMLPGFRMPVAPAPVVARPAPAPQGPPCPEEPEASLAALSLPSVVDPTHVPEPGTLGLFGIGLLGLGLSRRRRKS